MPEVLFDVCLSSDDGRAKLDLGKYQAVISDAFTAEAADYAFLKHAQALPCPVPFVLSEKPGDAGAVAGALTHGAVDLIRKSSRAQEAATVVRRALWLYRLRVTIHHRRQRLQQHRHRYRESFPTMSEERRQILERAIEDIEQTNRTCERTMLQIESSLRVLEELSCRFESQLRECALRMVRLRDLKS